MSGEARHIKTPQTVSDAIARLSAAGEVHMIPLLRAVARGRINLAVITLRDATLPKQLRGSMRPTVILVADDDDSASGPQGWRCTAAACEWATGAIIHGAGGKPEHYAAAVVDAERRGRLLFVETRPPHIEAWGARLLPKPVALIVPCDGLHPIATPRGRVH